MTYKQYICATCDCLNRDLCTDINIQTGLYFAISESTNFDNVLIYTVILRIDVLTQIRENIHVFCCDTNTGCHEL